MKTGKTHVLELASGQERSKVDEDKLKQVKRYQNA
jgi:hypothetical protein